MKGIIFQQDVWQAKRKVLEQYGEAQTRRLMNPQPFYSTLELPLMNCPEPVYVWQPRKKTSWYAWQRKEFQFDPCIINDARYQVDEVVYREEAWRVEGHSCKSGEQNIVRFKLDGVGIKHDAQDMFTNEYGRWLQSVSKAADTNIWQSPMFLPAYLARDFLQITAVRAERFYLDKIDPHEFILEGGEAAVYMLKKLEELWVWVYTFKPVSK